MAARKRVATGVTEKRIVRVGVEVEVEAEAEAEVVGLIVFLNGSVGQFCCLFICQISVTRPRDTKCLDEAKGHMCGRKEGNHMLTTFFSKQTYNIKFI